MYDGRSLLLRLIFNYIMNDLKLVIKIGLLFLVVISNSCDTQEKIGTKKEIEKQDVKLKVPPPPTLEKPQFVIDYENELDSLRLNRERRVNNLMLSVCQECLISNKESFVLSFILNPDGTIENPEIILENLDVNNSIDSINNCLESQIEIFKINLGEIKPLKIARQKNVFPIKYTLPIKKKTESYK